ncbi:MAG: hypothetical protein DRI61_09270 [Chloroflexi bacterium]|nr:MAG: hypothetical protein DRI61_09270 [Chloroflexota bacterium]
MWLTGIDTTSIYNAAANMTVGSSSLTLTIDASAIDKFLGKIIDVRIDNQNQFSALIDNCTDFGYTTGIATVSGFGLIDNALKIQYKDESSPVTNGSHYKGVRYARLDTSTGEIEPERIDRIIRRCISASSKQMTEQFGRIITVEFEGQTLEQKTEHVTWEGSTIGNIIKGYIDPIDDVLMYWQGDAIKIKRFDLDNADRVVNLRDVVSPAIGLNLANVFSEVGIESIDIADKTDSFTLGNSGDPKGRNLTKLVNNRFTKSGFTADGNIDETTGILIYDDTGSALESVVYGVDSRHLATSGKRYNRYDWKQKQIIIDPELGKVDTALTAFDRTDDQARLANKLARRLSMFEYTGSFDVESNYIVKIGDILKLWNLPYNVVVMGITADSINAIKTVSFGAKTGDRYGTIKSRTELAQAKVFSEDESVKKMEELLKGLNLSKEDRDKLTGAKREVNEKHGTGKLLRAMGMKEVKSYFAGGVFFGSAGGAEGRIAKTRKRRAFAGAEKGTSAGSASARYWNKQIKGK